MQSEVKVMGTIQWLHFSDLHLNKKGVETRRLRNKLPDYLKEQNVHCDYVFCTGDIRYAPSGKFPEDSAKHIQNICDAVHVPIDHLFVVPGNHDINRAANGRADAVHRIHNVTEQGGSGYYQPMDGEILIEDLSCIANGQADYVDLINTLYSRVPGRARLYGSAECPHFTVTTNDLNILHLDSTITYSAKQSHDFVIGTELLMNALEQIDKTKPTILLTHYSFDFLNRAEQEQVFSLLQDYHVQLWLAGHEHKHLCRYQWNYFHEFQCGNLVLESRARSCVLIGNLDLSTGIGEICVHAWFPQQGWTQYPFVRTGTNKNTVYPFKLALPSPPIQAPERLIEYQYDFVNSIDYKAEETDEVASGDCGRGAHWTLYKSGLLNIVGNGDIEKFSLPKEWDQNPYSEDRYIPREIAHKITRVRIENGIKSIGDYAFLSYGYLINIEIPESVTSIGRQAFDYCKSLTEITLPKNLEHIFSDAFPKELKKINVSAENTFFTEIDGVLFNYSKKALVCYPKGKEGSSYTIPDGVVLVGYDAFAICGDKLKEITIPNSVNYIDRYAFMNCSGLTSIVIPNSVRFIGDCAFCNCYNLSKVMIPENVTEIGYNVFGRCRKLCEIPVDPQNRIYISIDGVLFERARLKLVSYPVGKPGNRYIVPEGITTIGDNAFADCDNLMEVTLSKSLSSIGQSAFNDCNNLREIIIPKNVSEIWNCAFFSCKSLKKIVFLGDAPQIGSGAFYGVTALAYYPQNNRSWTDKVKQNYSGKITWVAQD